MSTLQYEIDKRKRENYFILKIFDLKFAVIICGFLFAILNFLTPLIADDYTYSFLYPTTKRLASVADIFVSQYNHYMLHGGRCVAHFIAQFFLFVGNKMIFNLFNTIVYCTFILLICFHITGSFKNIKSALFYAINIILWFLVPTWGQNFLWLTGSCNYLWTATLILLFLVPYRKRSDNPTYKLNSVLSILMLFLGILSGWSNENSAAAIFCLLIALFLLKIIKKEQFTLFETLGAVGFLIGFILLLSAPGNFVRFDESDNLQYSFLIKTIKRFVSVTSVFAQNYGLLFAILSVWIGYDMIRFQKRKIELFTIYYLLAGLASVYSMIMSPFFPERTFLIVTVFLIIALFNLVQNIEIKFPEIIKRNIPIFATLTFLFFFYSYFDASKNIYGINSRWKERIIFIENQKSKGIQNIEITNSISAWSKHSGAYKIPDLYTDTEKYPNKAIADFFEINSIKGVDEEDPW